MNQRTGPVTGLIKIALTLMYGVPLLWIVLTSFKTSADVFDTDAMFFFQPTVEAYSATFGPGLFDSLRQSVLIATGTTVLTLSLAVLASYALARVSTWIATPALGLMIVLQMLPQTANVIPLFQIFGNWGLLNNTLAVIIADTALLLPFSVILLRPFFRTVPVEMEEAAAIDGANVIRTFLSVVLPLARNGIATTGTLVFLLAWGEFLYAVNFFLTPDNYPLSVMLAEQVSAFGINWPRLMALAVMTSIPVLIVYTISYRLLRDGLTVGAVK